MLKFCPLASGSKGNALFVGTEKTRVLIDAGLSVRQLTQRLSEIAVDLSEIDAIVVTHEHIDHIKGIEILGCKLGIPIFANSDTAKAIYEIIGQSPKFKIFCTGEPFEYGDLTFSSFSLQHDAADPVGFTVRTGDWKVGVCADLGFVTSIVRAELQKCDILYVEANHQPNMVHACNRPVSYKQRVLSRQGHLSNEECADLVASVLHSGLKHVYLAHLSSECNAPELALEIVSERLAKEGYVPPLTIAHQDVVSLLMELGDVLIT